MSKLREAAQAALKHGAFPQGSGIIHALRAALAEPQPGWCPGCTPETCPGCGTVSEPPVPVGLPAGEQTGPVAGGSSQEPVQEPVAWRYKGEPWFDGNRWHDKFEVTTDERVAKFKDKDATPLYPAPPSRKPQDDTDLLRRAYALLGNAIVDPVDADEAEQLCAALRERLGEQE